MRAVCGFPVPNDEYLDDEIDLNAWLVQNPAATYLYRASGDSMALAGVMHGDVLVVDRSAPVRSGDLVLATWDGNQPACKIIRMFADRLELHSANAAYEPVVLRDNTEVEVYRIVGVVRKVSTSEGRRRDRAR